MVKEEGELAFELKNKILKHVIGLIEFFVELSIRILNFFYLDLAIVGLKFLCLHKGHLIRRERRSR